MNSLMAAQHFSTNEPRLSTVDREKMTAILSNISRHSSPEILCQQSASTSITVSPTRSSPGVLRTSSLPDTPINHPDLDQYGQINKRPSSVDFIHVAEKRQKILDVKLQHEETFDVDSMHGCKPPILSPVASEDNLSFETSLPNWLQVIKQLTNVRQGKSEAADATFSAEISQGFRHNSFDDQEVLARSVLNSLNQILNPNASAVIGDSHMNHESSEHHEDSNNGELDKKRLKIDHSTCSMSNNFNPPLPSPQSLLSPNLMVTPDVFTSTASMLALIMGQKPLTSQPLIPNPFTNSTFPLDNHVSQMNPKHDANPLFHTKSTDENMSHSKQPAQSFSDNRGFLYQLGQQLMAMASSPNPDSFSQNANMSFNQSIKNNNMTSDTSRLIFPPNSSSNLLLNPMLALMNAGLLQSPSGVGQHPPILPIGPLNSMDHRNPLGNQASIHTHGHIDKVLQNFPPPVNALGGISMRGNQKYSAYYQHQRKQGLTANPVNDHGNNRRSNSNLNTPFSSARYTNRRIKSGFGPLTMNSPGSRIPPCRGSTASSSNNTNVFSTFRGASYKHSFSNIGTNSMRPKGQLATDILMNNNQGHATETPVNHNRLRDTAFLCSCGRDFESLYGFTIHMKDSGHKPKSDQSERDIPKLVRGQDMWINSETEQTREILRCMRCHQSFRNLPELTLHMMKTNHYSEIVYNDSGRLVFVNPEEHRRSTQNGVTPPCAGNSPTKMGTQVSKRMLKSASILSDRLHSNNEASSIKNRKANLQTNVSHESDRLRDSDSPQIRVETTKSTSPVTKTKTPPLSQEAPTITESSTTLSSPRTDHSSPQRNLDNSEEHARLDSSPYTTGLGSSVIKQIESFVQSSLPQQSHRLSDLNENESLVTSVVSSPRSSVDAAIINNNNNNKYSPNNSRKRTFSGSTTILSQNHSGSSSPSNIEYEQFRSNKKVNHSPVSPNTVSSTNEQFSHSRQQKENPLCSLQKLVDTTHKSPFNVTASSSLNCSPFYANNHHSKIAVSATSIMGSLGNSPRSKTPTFSSGSRSSANSVSPTFSHLISPVGTSNENESALSALYAYVEKSSGSSTEFGNTKDESAPVSLNPPTVEYRPTSEVSNMESNLINPSFQALYLAALSSFAAQNMQSTPSTNRDPELTDRSNWSIKNPLRPDIDSEKSQTDIFSADTVDLASRWMKALQAFVFPNPKSDDSVTLEGSEYKEKESQANVTNHSTDQFLNMYQNLFRTAFDNNVTSRDESVPNWSQNTGVPRNSNASLFTSIMSRFGSNQHMPGSLSNSEFTINNGIHSTPSARTSHFGAMRAPPALNNQASIMSSIITKKAKCHFCGKPFANKGQVRLHISKNKCPCLLQRSCHVAALAAAFGSSENCSIPSGPEKLRSTPSSVGSAFMDSMKNAPQVPTMGNSDESYSAFGLLKERFQNYDLASITNTNKSTMECTRATNVQTNSVQNGPNDRLFGDNKIASPIESSTCQIGSSSCDPTNTNISSNACHMTAMALLAQTLVQLSSGQIPNFPGVPYSTPSNVHPSIPNPQKASTSGNPVTPTSHTNNGMNLDWLFNQSTLGSNLPGFNWSPSLSSAMKEKHHKDVSHDSANHEVRKSNS